jgi:hypothetical protein
VTRRTCHQQRRPETVQARFGAFRLVCGVDRADQAVFLIVDAGAEQQRVRAACRGGAEAQPPQVVDADGLALGVV